MSDDRAFRQIGFDTAGPTETQQYHGTAYAFGARY
jgi:hypothetical protein